MPPPSEFALILILTAALLHAVWNAIVKGSKDRGITIGLVAIGNALFGWMLVPFSPIPDPGSWIFIALTIFVHLFYFLFLISAYRLGDFSQVYPIARGVAPLLVATGGMIFAGEYLPLSGWAGVGLVSFAISLLVLSSARKTLIEGAGALVQGGRDNRAGKAVGAALMTGVCIASYTIVDGLGVRASGTQPGYIGWSFGLQIILGAGFLFWRREYLHTLSMRDYSAGIFGGLVSGLAYGLAIYAMSITTLGAVSAIRESSVIIASLIGVIWFGERPWKIRVLAAVIVAAGVWLLAL